MDLNCNCVISRCIEKLMAYSQGRTDLLFSSKKKAPLQNVISAYLVSQVTYEDLNLQLPDDFSWAQRFLVSKKFM